MLLLTRQLDCKIYIEKLYQKKRVRTRQLLTAKFPSRVRSLKKAKTALPKSLGKRKEIVARQVC